MSFWATDEGRLAVDRFDAWATCKRMEAEGGVGLMDGRGGAGVPSCNARGLSGAWLKAQDVVMTLRDWRCAWGGMERLLEFIYIEGTQEILTHAMYELVGGELVTMSASELASKGEPARYSEAGFRYERKRTYDLAHFEDEQVDAVLDRFLPASVGLGARRRLFLEWQHQIFARSMLAVRGVGADPQMPQRARSKLARAPSPARASYAAPTAEELAFAESVRLRAEELEAEAKALLEKAEAERQALLEARREAEYRRYMAGSVGVAASETDSGNLRGASQKVLQALADAEVIVDDSEQHALAAPE